MSAAEAPPKVVALVCTFFGDPKEYAMQLDEANLRVLSFGHSSDMKTTKANEHEITFKFNVENHAFEGTFIRSTNGVIISAGNVATIGRCHAVSNKTG